MGERYGSKQWRLVCREVPNRNSTQCQQRWSKVLIPGLKKGPWSKEEDEILKSSALRQLEGGNRKINWKAIAEKINARTAKQCRARWVNNLDPKLKKGSWTKEEDESILKWYAEMGSKWALIASMLEGRSENAVKIRYTSLKRKASKYRK